MISYIYTITPGNIVVAGVRDEGANSMTTAGWNALYTIGFTNGSTFGYRSAFILIGGKDRKANGTAIWAAKPTG